MLFLSWILAGGSSRSRSFSPGPVGLTREAGRMQAGLLQRPQSPGAFLDACRRARARALVPRTCGPRSRSSSGGVRRPRLGGSDKRSACASAARPAPSSPPTEELAAGRGGRAHDNSLASASRGAVEPAAVTFLDEASASPPPSCAAFLGRSGRLDVLNCNVSGLGKAGEGATPQANRDFPPHTTKSLYLRLPIHPSRRERALDRRCARARGARPHPQARPPSRRLRHSGATSTSAYGCDEVRTT